MTKSILGEMPESVAAAMYLRDGWPDAIVCKVLMKDGCIGIGLYRAKSNCRPISPAFADQAAMLDALQHISANPPDYTELHEHVAKMAAQASPATAYQEESDVDTQAALGQKAHD